MRKRPSPDDCLTYVPFPTEGEAVDPDDPFNDVVASRLFLGRSTPPVGHRRRERDPDWKANPDETAYEVVTVSVRFLAPVDEDDENKPERVMYESERGRSRRLADLAEDGFIPESARAMSPRAGARHSRVKTRKTAPSGSMMPAPPMGSTSRARGEPSHTSRRSPAASEGPDGTERLVHRDQ